MEIVATIEKCYINTPSVGRIGHHIPVSRPTQCRPYSQVTEHGVILDLTQAHKSWSLFLIGRNNHFRQRIQFIPVTGYGPVVIAIGSIIVIILYGIIIGIKKVLGITEHNRQPVASQRMRVNSLLALARFLLMSSPL